MKKVLSWTDLFTLNNTYGFIIIHIIDTSQVHVDFCPKGCKFTDSQKYTAYNNYISIFSPIFFFFFFLLCVHSSSFSVLFLCSISCTVAMPFALVFVPHPPLQPIESYTDIVYVDAAVLYITEHTHTHTHKQLLFFGKSVCSHICAE